MQGPVDPHICHLFRSFWYKKTWFFPSMVGNSPCIKALVGYQTRHQTARRRENTEIFYPLLVFGTCVFFISVFVPPRPQGSCSNILHICWNSELQPISQTQISWVQAKSMSSHLRLSKDTLTEGTDFGQYRIAPNMLMILSDFLPGRFYIHFQFPVH